MFKLNRCKCFKDKKSTMWTGAFGSIIAAIASTVVFTALGDHQGIKTNASNIVVNSDSIIRGTEYDAKQDLIIEELREGNISTRLTNAKILTHLEWLIKDAESRSN